MSPMNPRLLRPLASGFDPRRIAGLVGWWDAADPSTVLNSISPATPAADGQTVRRWLDKSGNGLHLEQSTGAWQPTYEYGLYITTDGSNDRMDVTLPSALGDYTAFFVWRPITTFAGFNAALSLDDTGAAMGLRETTKAYDAHYSFNVSAAGVVATGGDYLLASRNKSGTQEVFVDGSLVASGTGATVNFAPNKVTIGTNDNVGSEQFYNARIYAVVLYSRFLADAELVAVQSYLNKRHLS